MASQYQPGKRPMTETLLTLTQTNLPVFKFVSIVRGDIGWSVICDGDISWLFSMLLFCLLKQPPPPSMVIQVRVYRCRCYVKRDARTCFIMFCPLL